MGNRVPAILSWGRGEIPHSFSLCYLTWKENSPVAGDVILMAPNAKPKAQVKYLPVEIGDLPDDGVVSVPRRIEHCPVEWREVVAAARRKGYPIKEQGESAGGK